MQVTPAELTAISCLVNELCGITLDNTKGYLIRSRLSPLAKAVGCTTFHEFAQKAQSADNAALRNAIIDAITIQETLFFRDEFPFESLQHKVLPELIDAKSRTRSPRRLRLWSAACSTGQEPYSLAMILSESIRDIRSWDATILGTDISHVAIRQASTGRYAANEIQRGMKPHLLARYFTEDAAGWKVKDELRALVTFARRNLLEPVVDCGPFDIIFCRNLAIYFNAIARRNLFRRLAQQLSTDGYLFVGASECLTDLGPQFTPQHHGRASYYRPNMTPPPATSGAVRQVVPPAETGRLSLLTGA